MERFLIAAVGVVAIILALILAEHYRARGPSSAAAQRTKGAAAALGAVAGVVVVAALGAAGFAAFEWRSLAAQRHALDAQRSALAVAQREFAAQKETAYLASPPAEEPPTASPHAQQDAPVPPQFKPTAPVAPQARQPASARPPTAETGPVAHRARVAATASLGGALIIKAGEISLAARYQLENKGDAPAVGMQVASAVLLRAALDVRAAEEAVCRRLGGRDAAAPLRRPLMPQQSVAFGRVEGSGLAAGGERLMRVRAPGLKFWWVGCIAYRTQGEAESQRSGFAYRIAENGVGPRRLIPISLADQIIPKDRLVVIPYRGGGSSAD